MKAIQHLPAGYREIYAIDMLKGVRCLRVQGRFPAAPRQTQTRGKFMDVIARSEATRQSVSPAAAHNEKQHLGQTRNYLRIRPGRTWAQTPGKFLHVIARSEATWQSVLFAAAHNGKQHLGRIRSSLRVRLKCYFFLPFPAGRTDCHTSVRTGSQ